MAVTNAEIAEAAKNKRLLLEEETECAQLRESMTETNQIIINLQSALRRTNDDLTHLRSKITESPSNKTDRHRDSDNAGRSSPGSSTDHHRPRHDENTESTDRRPSKHRPFTEYAHVQWTDENENQMAHQEWFGATTNTQHGSTGDYPPWKQKAPYCMTRCRSTGLMVKMALVVNKTSLEEMNG